MSERGALHTWSNRREAGKEVDQPGEVHLLVVLHGQVAAFGAVEMASFRQDVCHLVQVCGIYRVVAGGHDEGRHVDGRTFTVGLLPKRFVQALNRPAEVSIGMRVTPLLRRL